MNKIFLRYLGLNDESAFNKALNENWESSFDFVHYWESLAKKDYKKYIKLAPGFSKGLHIPVEHVPCTFLFALNKQGEIVGRVSIRHKLNENLVQIGGHVGYGVVPSFRRKGYATSILNESIRYIKSNIPEIKDRILVTCNEGNIGSQKTIERNSGVLENILQIKDKEHKTMRFWINL